MFNSVVISIAITLVFIFLLLSLMVTAVNDIIFTLLRSKSKQLEKYLDELFFNDEQWKFIFSKIKNSPFINDIKKNEEYISSEVLSNKIEIVSSLSNFNEIEIDEVNFKINVEKI